MGRALSRYYCIVVGILLCDLVGTVAPNAKELTCNGRTVRTPDLGGHESCCVATVRGPTLSYFIFVVLEKRADPDRCSIATNCIDR